MILIPSRSLPRSSPMHFPSSPKFRVQVARPLDPHLVLDVAGVDVIQLPRTAVGIHAILGYKEYGNATRTGRIPSILAKTGWMMFSTRSWSPQEMKHFDGCDAEGAVGKPLRRCLQGPTSLPAPGSVRHIVPVHWPAYILYMYLFFCSSVPKYWSRPAAPCVNPDTSGRRNWPRKSAQSSPSP